MSPFSEKAYQKTAAQFPITYVHVDKWLGPFLVWDRLCKGGGSRGRQMGVGHLQLRLC